jgi:hypothetical protein
MKLRIAGTFIFIVSCCLTAGAQTWEVGGAGGLGVPRTLTVSNGTSSAQAGFTNGFSFGAVLGQQLYNHFSGEARYTYRSGDMKLSGNGQEPRLGAEGHAMHYDLLVNATKPGSAVRPFVAVGAGVEVFHGTSAPPVFQPLNNLAVLTQTTQVKPLVSAGGGIKFAMGHHAILRLDFRDYVTPVPEKLFATRANSRLNGWMHDLVFLVGISYAFHEPGY